MSTFGEKKDAFRNTVEAPPLTVLVALVVPQCSVNLPLTVSDAWARCAQIVPVTPTSTSTPRRVQVLELLRKTSPSRTSLVKHLSRRTKKHRGPILLCRANVFKACACLKHSNFLKVKDLDAESHNQVQPVLQEDAKAELNTHPEDGPCVPNRNPTASLFTAPTSIYAAGTSLAKYDE